MRSKSHLPEGRFLEHFRRAVVQKSRFERGLAQKSIIFFLLSFVNCRETAPQVLDFSILALNRPKPQKPRFFSNGKIDVLDFGLETPFFSISCLPH
jgi:hypothetical protein